MNHPAEAYDFWYALETSWPDAWVDSLTRACLQGGLALLAVWALCRLFPRMPIGTRHWLWWLACLKLIVTLFWLSPIQMPVGGATRARPADVPHATPSRSAYESIPGGRTGGKPSIAQELHVASRRHRPSRRPSAGVLKDLLAGQITPVQARYWRPLPLLIVLWILWLCGATWNISRAAKQVRRIRGILRRAVPHDNPRLLAELDSTCATAGITRPPELLRSTEIKAPLIAGILQPVVVIPAGADAEFSIEEWRMMLAHEAAHLARRDLWLALVPTLAQTLFFFFPLLWGACREWTIAREAACDAQALKMTDESPVRYGHMLLKVAIRGSDGNTFASMSLTSGHHTLAMRLRFMSQFSGRQRRGVPNFVFAWLTLCLLGVIPWRITTVATSASQPSSAAIVSLLRRQDSQRIVQSSPTAPYTITDLGAVLSSQLFVSEDRKGWRMLPMYSCINDAGLVVALVEEATARGGSRKRALVHWDERARTTLMGEYPATESSATDTAVQRAMRSTGCIPSDTRASGFTLSSAGEWRAIRPGDEKRLVLPGGKASTIAACSALGAVIGTCDTIVNGDGASPGFLYRNGTLVSLGLLTPYGRCQPHGVNDRNEVVGEATIRAGGSHAFLYSHGRMQDLNGLIPEESGWELMGAYSINNGGQIVGYGINHSGQQSFFLLTPH